jgi:hypothetical protein
MIKYILLSIGIAAIACLLLWMLKPLKISDAAAEKFSSVPDMPVNFGYKCSWLSVRTFDQKGLGLALSFKNLQPINWKEGVDKGYDYIDTKKLDMALSSKNFKKAVDKAVSSKIFISPPIDGWMLAICGKIPLVDHSSEDIFIKDLKSILIKLSSELGEAQYFASNRVSSYYCWCCAKNGRINRLYYYSDGTMLCEGEPIGLEKELKLLKPSDLDPENDVDLDDESIAWPDEELVLKIAGSWSINPATLSDRKDLQPSAGLYGTYP